MSDTQARWGTLLDEMESTERDMVELDLLLYGNFFLEVRDGRPYRVDPRTVCLVLGKPETAEGES